MTIHRLRTTYITLFALVAFLLTCPIPARAQARTLADLGLTYEGFVDLQTFGNETSFMRDITVRYVNGEQRFLSLTHTSRLHEYRLVALGGTVTTITRQWVLPGLKGHSGIWFEQAKNRLWVTTSEDYPNTDDVTPAAVTLVQLNDDGSTTQIGRWPIAGIPEKRMYGSCLPSPVTAGKYACGNGGYTSRVAANGGATIGPTLYEIPEPTSVPSGTPLTPRVLLDAFGTRGVTSTLRVNYFDGGDPRQNPSTRPTAPPASGAGFLSPNAQGLGVMTWGDSYYSTGMFIPTLGYVAVASTCKGSCWYQSSTLEFDWRQFDLQVWPVNTLTNGPTTRPSAMVDIPGPFGGGYTQENGKYKWGGNTATGNISGATYDATAGRVYLFGAPLGRDIYTARILVLRLTGAPPAPLPPPTTPGPTTPPVTPTPTPSTGLPSGYVLLIDEGKQATVPANTLVYFGDKGSYRTLTLSGTFWCNNSTFKGDPLPGNGKFCYGPGATSPPPPPPVVDANAVMSTWVLSSSTTWSACVSGSQTRTEIWTRTVVTPATGNGTTGAMSESRTGTQACTVPLAAPTIDTSAVSQCSVTLSAVPPAGSSWRLQFLEGASNRGSQVTAAPYRQTFTLAAGSHAIVARWTKSGATTQNSPAVTVACP